MLSRYLNWTSTLKSDACQYSMQGYIIQKESKRKDAVALEYSSNSVEKKY